MVASANNNIGVTDEQATLFKSVGVSPDWKTVSIDEAWDAYEEIARSVVRHCTGEDGFLTKHGEDVMDAHAALFDMILEAEEDA